MKNLTYIFIVLLFATSVFADGLLVPQEQDYPKDFLRNRSTQVQVVIHGLVAETTVTQEFVNEWDTDVDGVYCFPLPPDARATEFLYWYNDKVYKAILKVKEQASTPGTGQGGIIAYVNEYLGRNGIKVPLKNIPAGKIQRIQLSYISHCDYYKGEVSYTFPLKTDDFVKHPIDHLSFSVYVESSSDITAWNSPSHPNINTLIGEKNKLYVEMTQAKAYLASDFEFTYTTQTDELGVDFYSCENDTRDGHFLLYVRPQDEPEENDVLPQRMMFVLSRSSNMYGYVFQACMDAVKASLDNLCETDEFNIIIYDHNTQQWQSQFVAASSDNIQNAKNYLDGLATTWGSQLDAAIDLALPHFKNIDKNNVMLVFSDGMSSIDPRAIAERNTQRVGIFPVGIGDKLSRQRLEMLAALNYGFVTYFNMEDNLRQGIEQLYSKISSPVLKDAVMEFGNAGVHDILPQTYPSVYAGCNFMMSGRYQSPGKSGFAMAGLAAQGNASFGFQFDFGAQDDSCKFVEKMWAKEKIAALDREIEIYGETDDLKQQMISISLAYNIRCRYTAYVADYQNEYTRVESGPEVALPKSYIVQNYPNPFNPSTTIRIMLAEDSCGMVKILRIYNARGQLVAVIDLTNYQPGEHAVVFNGKDFYGTTLPSGHYFARLSVGNEISTIRMLLVK